MAYTNLQGVQSQVSNQLNAGLSSAASMSGASPLDTNILATLIPQGQQPTIFGKFKQQQDLANYGMSVNSSGWTMNNPLGGQSSMSFNPSSTGNTQAVMTNTNKSGNQSITSTIGGTAATAAKRLTNTVPQISNMSKNAQSLAGGIKTLNSTQAKAANITPSQVAGTSTDPIKGQFDAKVTEAATTAGSGIGKATEFMNSAAGAAVGAAANLVGGAVNQLGNMVGSYSDRPEAQQLNDTQEAVRSGVYSAVSMIPGWGPLISAGLQLTDGLGKIMGTQMSNISKDAAEDAGLSRGFNNVVASVPLVGSLMGAFAKKTDEFKIDRDRLAGVGSAYDMSTFDSAEDLSGGKFLGQGRKVNQFITEQNRKRDTMIGISDTAKMRKEGASTAAADLAQQNKNKYNGLTGGQMTIGQEGMKIPNLSWARTTLNTGPSKQDLTKLLLKFQKGGKLGNPGMESNVIVDGAYHAHKNHLDEIAPEIGEVTPKGIPVVATDESGNSQQIAEIEVGELVLTKDLTDKLEELYKDGSDEAAIQAGILFANEIINNTVDNKGGVLDGNN